jgi:hypothetical protein
MPRNFLKIPRHVRRQLRALDGEPFVVAGCLVVTSVAAIQRGDLSHLDITLDDSGLYFEREVLPSARGGKFSARNTNGWVEVRYDLPKEPYVVPLEAPNWHGSGTHTVYQNRERYPKIFHAPQFATVRVECRDTAPGRESYALRYEVSTVVDVTAVDFEQRVLESINLLQEERRRLWRCETKHELRRICAITSASVGGATTRHAGRSDHTRVQREDPQRRGCGQGRRSLRLSDELASHGNDIRPQWFSALLRCTASARYSPVRECGTWQCHVCDVRRLGAAEPKIAARAHVRTVWSRLRTCRAFW